MKPFRAALSRALNPGYSTCHRCRTAWAWTKPHHTQYTGHSACFPLCEECWRVLTPEQRLPYYRELWRTWLFQTPMYNWWDAWASWLYIEDAVRQGG